MSEEKKQEPKKKLTPIYYEEWRVDIKDGKAEKLKLVRKCVKITDEEAEILNNGVLTGFSTAPIMYFKPENNA